MQLPLDLSTLSEAERMARLERRKPKKKVKIEEDIEDDFDARKYVHLLKKWIDILVLMKYKKVLLLLWLILTLFVSNSSDTNVLFILTLYQLLWFND